MKAEVLDRFIQQCLKLESVDFPDVAYTLNLSWTKELKPAFKECWGKEAMEEMLEKMKFKLVNRLYVAAVKGAPIGKVPPPAVHIKEMIKLIDSGVLLGGGSEEEAEKPVMSEEEERRHKKRLGLN